MNKKQKRPLTLLEMMIVIFLIGLIGSVIGYNMKGSLDEGRAFKTEQAISQIRDALQLEMAKGHSRDEIVGNPELFLSNSGFVKDPKKMLKDGWGNDFKFESKSDNDFKITSDKFNNYKNNKKNKLKAKNIAANDDDEKDDNEA